MSPTREKVELTHKDHIGNLSVSGRIEGNRIFVDVTGKESGQQGRTRVELRCPINELHDIEDLTRGAIDGLLRRRQELQAMGVDV